MTNQDYEIALLLKNRICSLVSLVEMRVFGSRARKDHTPDSDLDIFIEVETIDRSTRRLLQDAAWEVGLDNNRIIAPLIFSRAEIEDSPHRSTPIIESVHEDGILI